MIPTKSIEDDIAAFSKNVTANRKIINGEGTWLFLTTLGCWSVSNSVLQLIAYIVAFSLFFIRASDSQNTVGFMHPKSTMKQIEVRINELDIGDAQKARRHDLATLQHDELKFLSMLRKGTPFFLCWSFFGVSLLYSMFHLNSWVK